MPERRCAPAFLPFVVIAVLYYADVIAPQLFRGKLCIYDSFREAMERNREKRKKKRKILEVKILLYRQKKKTISKCKLLDTKKYS